MHLKLILKSCFEPAKGITTGDLFNLITAHYTKEQSIASTVCNKLIGHSAGHSKF